MGIYDRDYYRRPTTRGGFGDFRLWSVTTWLIVINIAVFVSDAALHRMGAGALSPEDVVNELVTTPSAVNRAMYEAPMGPLERFGYFSVDRAIYGGQVWRFITYQFLHQQGTIFHLLFNMVALYFFGPMVESYLLGRRYLTFYLLCGIAGAVSYVILWKLHVLINNPYQPMIGASAGIFGVLIAATVIAPDAQIVLLFPPIPIKLRVLAWVMIGIAVYTVVTAADNAGGEASHIGGALAGLVLIKNVHLLNFVVPSRKPVRRRVAFRDWSRDLNH